MAFKPWPPIRTVLFYACISIASYLSLETAEIIKQVFKCHAPYHSTQNTEIPSSKTTYWCHVIKMPTDVRYIYRVSTIVK